MRRRAELKDALCDTAMRCAPPLRHYDDTFLMRAMDMRHAARVARAVSDIRHYDDAAAAQMPR